MAGLNRNRQRVQLDADSIVDAALRIAGAGESDALTVRRLGAELGADPTAIYRHFRDKDDLIRGALDRLIERALAQVDPQASWDDRLKALATAILEVFSAHPSVGSQAVVHSTGGPAEARTIEMVLGALMEAGLDDEDAVRFYAVLSSYVISLASAKCSALLAADAQERWIGFFPSLRQSSAPAAVRVRDRLEALRDRDVYEDGIRVIIDAVESRLPQSRVSD
jgi:AcrR family transcriptional regulator